MFAFFVFRALCWFWRYSPLCSSTGCRVVRGQTAPKKSVQHSIDVGTRVFHWVSRQRLYFRQHRSRTRRRDCLSTHALALTQVRTSDMLSGPLTPSNCGLIWFGRVGFGHSYRRRNQCSVGRHTSSTTVLQSECEMSSGTHIVEPPRRYLACTTPQLTRLTGA